MEATGKRPDALAGPVGETLADAAVESATRAEEPSDAIEQRDHAEQKMRLANEIQR